MTRQEMNKQKKNTDLMEWMAGSTDKYAINGHGKIFTQKNY